MNSNNETEFAAGFSWRRAEAGVKQRGWLRDLTITLLITLAASLLCICMIQCFAGNLLHFLDPNLEPYAAWLRLLSLWLFFIVFNNLIGYHYLNGLDRSSAFRNVNIIYSVATLILMVAGCAFYSFKGCIMAVIAGEIALSLMLLYLIRHERQDFAHAIRAAKSKK